MTTYKPTIKQCLVGMCKDPVTWINLGVAIAFIYLTTSSLPKNYPSATILYVIGGAIIVFTVFTRFSLAKGRIKVNYKLKEMDALLLEINGVAQKGNAPKPTAKPVLKNRK